MSSPSSTASNAVRVLVAVALAVHVLFPTIYLVALVQHGPVENDWWHLKLVAEHFVAGDQNRLNAAGELAIDPHFYWRYPPYALYLVAPLAWLTRAHATPDGPSCPWHGSC